MGLFDFNANDPLSYEALQTRRKIAEQIAGRRAQPYPKNVGEGIFSAADSFADAYGQKSLESRLAAYEKQYQADVDKRYGAGGLAPSSVVAPFATPRSIVPTVPTVPRRRRADMPYGASSVADLGQQPPMGETFNMADYGRRPDDEDYRYG